MPSDSYGEWDVIPSKRERHDFHVSTNTTHGTYRAQCNVCSWMGLPHVSRNAAEADGDEHMLLMSGDDDG
jgi:hypothetical protein